MTNSRRHHFISQCYLKGFTLDGSADSQLHVINIKDGETFSTRPINVAVERDFNAVEGRPEGELEAQLAQIEADVAVALDRVIAARSIANASDWHLVLNLVALFAIRHPAWRSEVARFTAELMRMATSLALATPERWASQVRAMKAAGYGNDEDFDLPYEVIKKFHDDGDYDVVMPRAWHIGLEFETVDPILKTLVQRSWTLVTSDNPTDVFLTTDNPICLVHDDLTLPNLNRPAGHGMKATTILFAINRQLLAIGSFEGRSESMSVGSYEVAFLNGLIAPFAHRHIFAPSDDFSIVVTGGSAPLRGADFPRWIQSLRSSSSQ